jgi:hypothetical protein
MKLNISQTKIITFSRKTNTLIYDYKLCQSSLTRTDYIKDLEIFLDSKLQFHDHVNHVFSPCIKLLGLVRSITFTFSSLDCMHKLYIALIRSKVEYASVVWNSITSTGASKLERIQRRFAALCLIDFSLTFITVLFALEQLKLHTLRMRRQHLDALFFIQVYRGSKFCPSVLENVGLRVPARRIGDFTLFSVCSSSRYCPSARCASSVNVVCKDIDVFGAKPVLLNHIL